jgi:hypothetical protein
VVGCLYVENPILEVKIKGDEGEGDDDNWEILSVTISFNRSARCLKGATRINFILIEKRRGRRRRRRGGDSLLRVLVEEAREGEVGELLC